MMKNRFIGCVVALALAAVSMVATAEPVFAQFEPKSMVAAHEAYEGFHAESVGVLPKLSETARLCSAVAGEKSRDEHDDLISSAHVGQTLAAPAPFDPGKGYAQT